MKKKKQHNDVLFDYLPFRSVHLIHCSKYSKLTFHLLQAPRDSSRGQVSPSRVLPAPRNSSVLAVSSFSWVARFLWISGSPTHLRQYLTQETGLHLLANCQCPLCLRPRLRLGMTSRPQYLHRSTSASGVFQDLFLQVLICRFHHPLCKGGRNVCDQLIKPVKSVGSSTKMSGHALWPNMKREGARVYFFQRMSLEISTAFFGPFQSNSKS